MMIVTEKKFCIFCMTWFCWHWGLLLFGFLPSPYRHPVLVSALWLDGMMFLTFFILLFTKLDEIKANRWDQKRSIPRTSQAGIAKTQ